MKHIRKILALLVVAAMFAAMGVSALAAASITIERDSSYKGTGDGNTYKYYKIFSADYESNTSTGGGSTAGAPGDITESAEHASYTASSGVAAKLGTWGKVYYTDDTYTTKSNSATEFARDEWTRAEGNEWFDLTPIAGTTNYNVAWHGAETAERVQAAAAWLIEKEAYEGTAIELTFTEGTGWTSGDIDAGYYLVEGATGKNLVAATTDVTITEKNTYPPLDKTQADEDDDEKNDEVRDVAIGDELDYDVKVTIPATAAVGDKILVYDKNSIGLTFKAGSLTVTNTANADVGTSDYTGEGKVDGAAWQRLITVTEGSQGKDVVFSFKMTVNESALIDSEKENESGLKFGPGSGEKPWPYESTPDKVEYKTYFAGIHKTDGETHKDMPGVKFELKEGGVAFNVTKVGDYYIPGGSSNVVETDASGLIMIRGLDEDKTYTLTETETLTGYNMLTADVTLTEYEDTSATYTQATTYDASATYYNADGTVATVADEAAFTAGKFYTKTSGTESFSTAAADKAADEWGKVENLKGQVLPSTGGIGTTIFYVVGGILVAGAGVILITKRRLLKEQ